MRDVYILSAQRTPIGAFLGELAELPAAALGATAIEGAIAAAATTEQDVDALKAAVEHVIMGNVLQAGQGQAPARQAALKAGLPDAVGAVTLNKICGSGMRAVMDAANAIRAGEWDLMVAGGMESMSNAPHLLPGVRRGLRLGDASLVDALVHDGLWDPYGDKHMGQCAEACAERYILGREAQDAFALDSYQRARQAQEAGLFDAEITPVEVPQRRGDTECVSMDEEPFKAPLEKMAKLRPAFDVEGSITAANASKLNDGAAALLLAGADKAEAMGLRPLARIVSYASHAHAPEWFTTAPVQAVHKVLDRAGLTVADIDRWEINEAFAVVTQAAEWELGLDHARVNVRGGAVALGHPIGASGARILTTLLHTLIADGKRYGCAAICIGGGEATAMVIENLTL